MIQAKSVRMAISNVIRSVTEIVDKNRVSAEKLPMSARMFLMKYFPHQTIACARINGLTYNVNLDDGTKLVFDLIGNCDMLNCAKTAIPVNIIPQGIVNYLDACCPDKSMIKITKKESGYVIELSNGSVQNFNEYGALN